MKVLILLITILFISSAFADSTQMRVIEVTGTVTTIEKVNVLSGQAYYVPVIIDSKSGKQIELQLSSAEEPKTWLIESTKLRDGDDVYILGAGRFESVLEVIDRIEVRFSAIQDLSCVVTSDNKRYDDIFVLEARKEGLSKIKYKRQHLQSPEGQYGELEIVRGCYHARLVENNDSPQTISIECQSDGEEGIAAIDFNSLSGTLYFYQPKIG